MLLSNLNVPTNCLSGTLWNKARAAIKWLVKDGRYDYIETDLLVSINSNVKDVVILSENYGVSM